MTADQAQADAETLRSLKALRNSPAWQQCIAPAFASALERHLTGLSNRDLTPDQRTQHVEAYHLAVDLSSLIPYRIKRLEKTLAQYLTENDIVDSRLADSLS